MLLRSVLATTALAVAAASAPLSAAEPIDFEKQIKPILEKSCVKCHSEEEENGALRLETRELALKGGDSGPAITPNKPEESTVIERISLPPDDFLIMPAEGDPLTKEQIELLTAWVKQGAKWPEGVVLKSPDARPPQEGPPPIALEPLTDAEKQAVARMRELGGHVMELAQNDNRLTVAWHLADGTVGDDKLAPVKGVQHVYELNLRGTDVTDAGLANLKELPYLTRLHLEKTKITDAGLQHLSDLKNLEYLNVYGTAVTDAGLEHLKGLTNLKKLYVWETGVTAKGAKSLRATLPELEIVPDFKPEPPVEAPKPEPAKEEKKEEKKEEQKKDEQPKKEEKKDEKPEDKKAEPAKEKDADKKDEKKADDK